jgi:outer membrane lipoprotein carrier protein
LKEQSRAKPITADAHQTRKDTLQSPSSVKTQFKRSVSRVSALSICSVFVLLLRAWALPNVHAFAQAVDEHYNRLHSLEAEFTEIYQGMGVERTESGTLWLKKPGKMRWEYRSPQEKLFIGDSKNAWLYLPAERQVRRSDMRKLEDLRSPLAFLLGKTKLEKELQGLAFAPEVAPWKPADVVLKGVPRGMEDRVRDILLEVTAEHQIARILIHGADDSITEYRFSDQHEDVQIPDSKFHFTPPAGSEVIEDQSGQ